MTQPTELHAVAEVGRRNAEQMARTDAAVAGLSARLAALTSAVDTIRDTIAGHTDALRSADELQDTVGELLARFTALFPDTDDSGGAFYTPIPAPRFWQLQGEDREQAVTRLRSWVRDVYTPAFGHLARQLPACWEQHPFCLTVLDVASELHSVLYLQPTRSQGLLAGQAELLTRLMPALAALMTAETARCPHAQAGREYANGTPVPAASNGSPGRREAG